MPQLIFALVMIALSVALRPKPPKPKPPALGDFDFPQIEEGTPQIVVFGDCWIEPWMVLGVGNYRTQPVKSGGK